MKDKKLEVIKRKVRVLMKDAEDQMQESKAKDFWHLPVEVRFRLMDQSIKLRVAYNNRRNQLRSADRKALLSLKKENPQRYIDLYTEELEKIDRKEE